MKIALPLTFLPSFSFMSFFYFCVAQCFLHPFLLPFHPPFLSFFLFYFPFSLEIYFSLSCTLSKYFEVIHKSHGVAIAAHRVRWKAILWLWLWFPESCDFSIPSFESVLLTHCGPLATLSWLLSLATVLWRCCLPADVILTTGLPSQLSPTFTIVLDLPRASSHEKGY